MKGVSLSEVRDKLHAQYGELRFSPTQPAPPPLARHSRSIELTLIYFYRGAFDLQVTLFEYNPIWYVVGHDQIAPGSNFDFDRN